MIVDTAHSGHRWKSASAFVIFGFIAIIAAGFLAAVTASIPQRQIFWAIAYLVLVVGIAQIGLGTGQAWLAERPTGTPTVTAQFVAFNLGNAGVIGGTFADSPLLVDAGGVALVISLVLFVWGTRGSTHNWLKTVYWILLGILIVSIPIGLILSHLRAG
ncbi:hypothetical protein [Brevibacterium linens]|uniref:hypothetical protein n=1 Tax=Brevibacterium linens TaxID=1703 RepID=UPI003BF5CD57